MLRISRRYVVQLLIPFCILTPIFSQAWDLGSRGADTVSRETEGKLVLSFETRARYERRDGINFGRDPDLETGLIRTRLGLTYKPVRWLKISGMLQDSRSPWYGNNAPSTVRDEADLHEAYFEIRPDAKNGFGMIAGRMMLNYGEARLLGTPQWGNLARTYDNARLYYRMPKARFEILLVSPVKIRIGEFNRPVLGDRVWGTYNVFPGVYKASQLDVYVLRHDQNRPGGFTTGTRSADIDKMGTNTFGGRLSGPLSKSLKYSTELALQNGKVGPSEHRGSAFYGSLVRRFSVAGKTLDISGEYKYASGTDNPSDTRRTNSFDPIYPANHDKFGHQDLFGWRNMHNVRSLTTLGVTKNLGLNFMYDNIWLASAADSLYNSAGRTIVRSATGTDGRHVGQGTDLFGTYKYKHFAFGAGGGYWFRGEFILKTTPGVSPVYLYLFHTYSF